MDPNFVRSLALRNAGCAGSFGEWTAIRDQAPGRPITGYRGTFKPWADAAVQAEKFLARTLRTAKPQP